MRNKLIILALFLAVMALLPVISVSCLPGGNVKNTHETADSAESTPVPSSIAETADDMTDLSKTNVTDGFCEEAKKALAVLEANNLSYDPDRYYIEMKEIAGADPKEEADSRQKKYGKEISAEKLTLDGKNMYIPFALCSNGNTVKDGAFESVASPWDCGSDFYSENAKCTGVSLSGINSLCESGFTYAQALRWYLPGFDIASAS